MITVANTFYYAMNNSFDGIKYEKGKLNFRKVIEEKDKLVEKFRKEKYADLVKSLENVTLWKDGRNSLQKTSEVNGEKISGIDLAAAIGQACARNQL